MNQNHKLLLYIATTYGWTLSPEQTCYIKQLYDRQHTAAVIICYHHNLQKNGEYEFRELINTEEIRIKKEVSSLTNPHKCYYNKESSSVGLTTIYFSMPDPNCNEIANFTVNHPYKFDWQKQSWIETCDSCGLVIQKYRKKDKLHNQPMSFTHSLMYCMDTEFFQTSEDSQQQFKQYIIKYWKPMIESINASIAEPNVEESKSKQNSIQSSDDGYYVSSHRQSLPHNKLNLHRARSRRKQKRNKSHMNQNKKRNTDGVTHKIHTLQQIASNTEIFRTTELQNSMVAIIEEIASICTKYTDESDLEQFEDQTEPKPIKNIPTKKSTKHQCLIKMFPLLQDSALTENDKLKVLQTFCIPLTRWKNWIRNNYHHNVSEDAKQEEMDKYTRHKKKTKNTVQNAVYEFVHKKGAFALLNSQNYWLYRQHYTQPKISAFISHNDDDVSVCTDDLQ